MKHRYELMYWQPWQLDQLCRRFEKRAREGWQLERAQAVLRYRKDTPRPTRYAAAFFNEISSYDPAPTARQLEYNELCAAAGWEQVAQIDNVQIFRTDRADAPPLETDDGLRLASIRRGMHRTLLWQGVLCLLVVLQLLMWQQNLRADPVEAVSSAYTLYAGAFWLLLLLELASQLGAYGLWLRRARRAATAGEGLPGSRSGWTYVQTGLLAVIVVLLVLMLAAVGPWQYGAVAFGIVALTLCIGMGVQRLCKRLGVSRGGNYAITVAAILVTMFALQAAGIAYLLAYLPAADAPAVERVVTAPDGESWTVTLYRDEVPLTLDDLGIEIPAGQEDDYSFRRTEERSPLASRIEVQIDPLTREDDAPWVEYRVLDTAVLADVCFAAWREESDFWSDAGAGCVRTDDPAWQAEEVWENHESDVRAHEYLVRRGGRMLYWRGSWALTGEQIAQAAALLDS